VTAVTRAASGGRKLQAAIIGVVVLAATATSTVALGLLADAHGPFDRAFEAQHGAEVTATFDPARVTQARLEATARLAAVTAAAGPFAEVTVTAQVIVSGVAGSVPVPLRIAGRGGPGGPVDDLTLDSGHWPAGDRQIVVARGTGVFPGAVVTVGGQKLTVCGVAESVTGSAQAWALPREVAALAGRTGRLQTQMLYRFSSAGTASAVAKDIAALRAALPDRVWLNAVSYLEVRQAEQGSIEPWVPFIVAFGLIALVISVLIVVNVVGGAVIAGTTRIGVLKSLGFTPAQVVTAYVLMVTVPALAGCAAGVVAGNLLAIPMLAVNAHVYQVGALGIPFWVDVTVPLAALALVVAGAVPPALRAGRMSAVQAIATGRAPSAARGYAAHRALARLSSAPRAVTLGLAAPFARPGRSLLTAVAVVFGATAVTFGVGLGASLDRVVSDTPQVSLPVQVAVNSAGPGPRGPGAMTAVEQRRIVAVLSAQPGTLHYLPVTYAQLSLPGVADSVSVTAYGGNPRLAGRPLTAGRWYHAQPEADVNTLFLAATGTSIGSVYLLTAGGHRITVHIVGEVFQPGKNLDLYVNPATLAAADPGVRPQQYDVAVRRGVSVPRTPGTRRRCSRCTSRPNWSCSRWPAWSPAWPGHSARRAWRPGPGPLPPFAPSRRPGPPMATSAGAGLALAGADSLDELRDAFVGEMPRDVRFTDHSGELSVAGHGQAADLVLLHELKDLADVRARVHGDRLALGQLPGGDGGGIKPAGYAFGHDVAVSDDALQSVVVAADRQGSDVQVAHPPRRVLQALMLADAFGSGMHDVTCSGHG
jgi:putative ABC transport system permease protein